MPEVVTEEQFADVAKYMNAISELGEGADVRVFVTALVYTLAAIIKLQYEDEKAAADNACNMLNLLVDEGHLVHERIQ